MGRPVRSALGRGYCPPPASAGEGSPLPRPSAGAAASPSAERLVGWVEAPEADRVAYGLAVQMEVSARAARESVARQIIADQAGLYPGRQVRLVSGPGGPWTIFLVQPLLDPATSEIAFDLVLARHGDARTVSTEQVHLLELIPLPERGEGA
jgi:hypothetical protein